MAKKVTKSKATSKLRNKRGTASSLQNSSIGGAAAILFAGTCIVLLGNLQEGNIELLLIGFGAALMFVAAVLLGMGINKKS